MNRPQLTWYVTLITVIWLLIFCGCSVEDSPVTDDDSADDDDDAVDDDDDDDDNDDNDTADDDDDDAADDDDDDQDSDSGDDDDDDDTDIPGECGNGVIDGDEQCDGDELGGEDCESLDFLSGELFCNDDCTFDTTECCEPPPSPDQDWMEQFQQEVLAKLTGADEIVPGVSLKHRYSDEEREYAAQYLLEVFEDLGYEPLLHEYGSGANPYVILEATEPSDEWVIYGAHYDSVSAGPGASDNASGTAVITTLARYASMIDCRSRNLVFVAFDQEERGLIGSQAFVDLVQENDWNLHSMHNFDMTCWDKDGDRVVEIGTRDYSMFEFYEQVVADSEFDIPVAKSELMASDHNSFDREGYDAVMLIEEFSLGDRSDFYHQSGDTYNSIVPYFYFMKQVTVLAGLGIAELTLVE